MLETRKAGAQSTLIPVTVVARICLHPAQWVRMRFLHGVLVSGHSPVSALSRAFSGYVSLSRLWGS